MASEMKNDSDKKEVSVSDNGGIILDNAEHRICCLTIIGHIEGHYILSDDKKTTKYEHIIPVIAAVEQDTLTEGVLIIINTAGGDVEAGLAIAEMIAGMSKPTVSSCCRRQSFNRRTACRQCRLFFYSSVCVNDCSPCKA